MYSYYTNSTVAVTLVTYLKYFCNGIVRSFPSNEYFNSHYFNIILLSRVYKPHFDLSSTFTPLT